MFLWCVADKVRKLTDVWSLVSVTARATVSLGRRPRIQPDDFYARYSLGT